MSIDLDQIADRMVADKPTTLPALDAIHQRARQRRRRARLVGTAVLVPLVALAGVGLWAAVDDTREVEVVAAGAAPVEADDPGPASAPAERDTAVTVPVPALVDLSTAEATASLNAAGLSYEIISAPAAASGQAPGVVVAADPVAGTLIAPDAIVTLSVTRSPICGNVLPVTVGLAAPADQRTSEVSVNDQLDLVQEITLNSGETVTVRWPAQERIAYDLTDGIPLFAPARLEPAALASGHIGYTLTGLDKAEQQIGPAVQLVLPAKNESATSPQTGCEIVEISITSGDKTAIFGWNLTNSGWSIRRDGAVGFPLANLAPLVTSTEHVTQPPGSTVGCAANQRQDETSGQQRFNSPVDALAAFLDSAPAATFIKSGFHEMIAADGSYTFGILSDIPARTPRSTDDFVTLITAAESDGGWEIVGWTASSC